MLGQSKFLIVKQPVSIGVSQPVGNILDFMYDLNVMDEFDAMDKFDASDEFDAMDDFDANLWMILMPPDLSQDVVGQLRLEQFVSRHST